MFEWTPDLGRAVLHGLDVYAQGATMQGINQDETYLVNRFAPCYLRSVRTDLSRLQTYSQRQVGFTPAPPR